MVRSGGRRRRRGQVWDAVEDGLPVAATAAALVLLCLVAFRGQSTGSVAAVQAETRQAGPPVVVVVTGAGSMDELVAASLGDAVVALPPSGLTSETVDELRRLAPDELVVLGGREVVGEQAAQELAALTGATVTRLAGPDRYGTAARAATSTFTAPVQQVVVTAVGASPEAVGAASADAGGPVLLVTPTSVPAATIAALQRLQPESVAVVGAADVVPDAVVEQLRRHTAGEVSRLSTP